MTISFDPADVNGATDVRARRAGLPPSLSPADQETGWQMSLAKLAALVEAG